MDEEVEVENAFVGAGTYVGKYTRISRAIASGRVLVDMARAVRLELSERFILSPVGAPDSRPGPGERLAALVCSALLAPAAALWNRGRWTEQRVTACENDLISLRTGRRGPLWLRRWPWLRHIAAGRLRWIGALPRQPKRISSACRRNWPSRCAPRGRGCFRWRTCTDAPAWRTRKNGSTPATRCRPPIPTLNRRLWKNVWKIAWSQPTPTLQAPTR